MLAACPHFSNHANTKSIEWDFIQLALPVFGTRNRSRTALNTIFECLTNHSEDNLISFFYTPSMKASLQHERKTEKEMEREREKATKNKSPNQISFVSLFIHSIVCLSAVKWTNLYSLFFRHKTSGAHAASHTTHSPMAHSPIDCGALTLKVIVLKISCTMMCYMCLSMLCICICMQQQP